MKTGANDHRPGTRRPQRCHHLISTRNISSIHQIDMNQTHLIVIYGPHAGEEGITKALRPTSDNC